MKFIATLIAIPLILTAAPAQACTYKQAQTKMVAFNNMLQVFNRQFIDQMKKTGDTTAALTQKRTAMAEESAAIGILLNKEYEKNPKIQFADKVDPKICSGYDGLMTKYAPKGYQGAKVETQAQKASPTCTTNDLWKRYGKAIQTQRKLAVAGKITKAETPDYMTLSTYIGQYATTDLAKACIKLTEFEKKLASE